jgi:Leucine-rich repeat (LRR) protein
MLLLISGEAPNPIVRTEAGPRHKVPSMNRAAGRSRRWFQFRLKMALGCLVLCSVLFAGARMRIDNYRKQWDSFQSISPLAVFVNAKEGKPRFLAPFADGKTFADITHLSFHGQPKFDNPAAAHLAHLPRLTRLSLHGTGIGDQAIKYLSLLTELDTLSLKSTEIGDEGIRHLAGLENLRHLQLCGSRVTSACIRDLATIKRLEILEMSHVRLEDQDAELLAGLPRLRQISFSSDHLSPIGFAHLSEIESLTTIQLSTTSGGEIAIRSFPQLSGLYIHSDGFQYPLELSLIDLPALTNLTLNMRRLDSLEIQGVEKLPRLVVVASKVGPNVVPELSHLRGLRELSLRSARFPSSCLTKLADLPALKVLELNNVNLTDEDLERLAEFKNLEALDLSANQLRGHGIHWLVNLPKLRSLRLSVPRGNLRALALRRRSLTLPASVADSERFDAKTTCQALAKIKTLNHLELDGFQPGKDDFMLLAQLPALKHFVADTTALSDKDFDEVSKLLPMTEAFAPDRGVR